jgi:uncharacterized membrane protein
MSMRTGLKRPLHRLAQRGSMGMLGAATIALAFTFAALAIDSGRLWSAHQDIQHAADMAALAAARHNGCGTTLDEAKERATESAKQFGIDPSQAGVTLLVTRGTMGTGGSGGGQAQTFIAAGEPSSTTNAAQVVLTKTIPKSLLMGGFIGQTLDLSATATAKGEAPQATLALGTRFNITDQQAEFVTKMFAGILGNSSLNLTKDSLESLTKGVINLEALRVVAGVNSVNDLLNLRVSVPELLRWISLTATGLDSGGQSALADLISASAGPGNLTVLVSDIFSVNTPAPAGVATANINVLDLVTAALQIGGGDHLITLNVSLARVTNLSLKLLSLPKIAIGPKGQDIDGNWCTRAKMAQIELIAGVDTSGLPTFKFPLLGISASVTADIAIRVVAGGVQGHLTELFADSSGGLARVETLSSPIVISLSDNASNTTSPGKPAKVAINVKALGLPLNAELDLGLVLPSAETKGKTMEINVPAPVRANMPQRVARPTDIKDALQSATQGGDITLKTKLLGLGEVVDAVVLILKPALKLLIFNVLTPLLNDVVLPLLEALGVGGTGVSVELRDIQAPQPVLKI